VPMVVLVFEVADHHSARRCISLPKPGRTSKIRRTALDAIVFIVAVEDAGALISDAEVAETPTRYAAAAHWSCGWCGAPGQRRPLPPTTLAAPERYPNLHLADPFPLQGYRKWPRRSAWPAVELDSEVPAARASLPIGQ
jgi:hypothetical protein